MVENPYVRLRREARVTQQHLAALCDVTPQYIQRLEAGTVGDPNIGVLQELLDFPGTVGTVESAAKEFDQWRRGLRANFRQNLHRLGFKWPEEWLNERQTISWILSFIESPDTVNAFCRLLALHPFTVQRWAAGEFSPSVDAAIEQAVGGYVLRKMHAEYQEEKKNDS